MVTFLHLADVHLGLRVTRFDRAICDKLREARFQALDNALQAAQREGVDFVCLAGDLFDDNSVSLIEAERAFSLLQGKPMPVLVLPGNHDPFCAGSVWERQPWTNTDGTAVRLLTRPEPYRVRNDVVIYPCPLATKTGRQDPTAWIPGRDATAERDAFRIGLAHGCVMDRPQLPPDDHPIPPEAPSRLGLDYLALGHWHRGRQFTDERGAVRMAYPGTCEQMTFGGEQAYNVGWQPYSLGAPCDELIGAEAGRALLVTLREPGAVPQVRPLEVGQYHWLSETLDLLEDSDFETAFSAIARREAAERCLLRLKLRGTVSIEVLRRLEGLEDMVKRYLYCDLDAAGLQMRPSEAELASVVGSGVLSGVLQQLRQQMEQGEAEERAVAQRATLLLYQVAREVGA
jgi:DNA repair exonuclease SbcCD nuclease subunit